MWVTIKCFLFVSVLFLLNITDTIAQKKVKFGDISTEDISVIADNDTTASAIILYENCSVRLDIVNDDFALVTQHMVRIKVLKASGLDWANIVIPFYVTNSRENSESVYSISGYTYNEANGKIDRVKLSKEHIFEEKTSENQKRIKIAFPNVKAGSVFELKYEKSSPYYSYIDDFIFQKSIPVKYSTYKVVIPEYFRFSKRTGGYETMDYNEDKINMSMMLNGGNRLSCTGSEMTFTVSELPALKDDNFVWNKDDYRSKVIFDLVRVEIPGILFKNFSATWEDIDKQLTEDDKFGKQLKYSNLLKNELSGILNDTLSSADQVTAILNLVKGKVQWNEKNTLYIDNVKKALKEGVGTSGELNALLICLLRDAGFNITPVKR